MIFAREKYRRGGARMHSKLEERWLRCAVWLTAGMLVPATGLAQQDPATTSGQGFPVKPIRIVVGVAPGGATDILARAVGAKLAESLKQQVIVDNRPGANHIIGGQLTAKSAPDG